MSPNTTGTPNRPRKDEVKQTYILQTKQKVDDLRVNGKGYGKQNTIVDRDEVQELI